MSSATLLRLLVFAVFAVSAFAGFESGRYRYDELNLSAFAVYGVSLADIGLSQRAFVLYFIITESLVAATYAFTGLFIALRGPKTSMAMFAAIALMLYGVTIPPPMHGLVVNEPLLPQWLVLERSVGLAAFLLFAYTFPDIRFASWRIWALSVAVCGWVLAWPFFPQLNPYTFHAPWPFIAIAATLATGVAVQLSRFRRLETPLERQQTKWVVYAIAACVLGDLVTHLPWQIFHLQRGADLTILLLHQPFFVAFQIVVPIAIAFSVLYFKLWEIDFVLSRTLIYGIVTAAAAILWEAVNITAGKLIEKAMGPQASAFAGGTATVVTGFFLKPMYEAVKRNIDQRLTPPTLDLSDEFPELEPDLRTRLTAPIIVDAVAKHTALAFEVPYSAVYRYRDGAFTMISEEGTPSGDAPKPTVGDDAFRLLQQGKAARPDTADDGPVFVPLVIPRARNPDLLGVLVLDRRGDAKGYSQLEIGALENLGRKAGLALYIADTRAAVATVR